MAYDVAFALVWADGDEVLNVNEAHAYASCSDCVAVAVAFQVVLVMDDARVVVPQNLAVAANYDCYQCITAAIASQLVLSLPGEPGEEELRALGEVWNQLIELANAITSYSLTEIVAQLEAFKAEIVAILDAAPAVDERRAATTSTPTPSGAESASPSPSSPSAPTTSQAGTTAPPPSAGESTTPAAPSPSATPTPPASPTPASPTSPTWTTPEASQPSTASPSP
jgi:putative peptide zinc metalloprotease protein